LSQKEIKNRIDTLQQIALKESENYPFPMSDAKMMFMCSLFIELTELGGSIPEQLQRIVSDSIKNGDLISAIPKLKGRPEAWTTSYKVCEKLLERILKSKKELSLNKHVDDLAKELNKSSSAIYKIIKKHGNTFAYLHLDCLKAKNGDIPDNVRNVIEVIFMSKADKEFQDYKDFATENPNSIKNKRNPS
jgi:hypothetical protein